MALTAADLTTLNSVRVDLVGGDRIMRQGSDIKRVFILTIAGVPQDLTSVTLIAVQYRDINNDALVMTGTGVVETGLGTGYFSANLTNVVTEAVDADTFPFLPETINGNDWLVLTGVYDVEFTIGTTIGCPVEGHWKMRRGVTR